MNRRRVAAGSPALVLSACLGLAAASCASVPSPTIEAPISLAAGTSTTPPATAPAVTVRTATPTPTEIVSSAPLPGPGGTCTASQLVLGTARSGFTFSTVFSRHAYLDQPLRNAGGACVLSVPAMIGVASATGPFQAVRANNIGYEVCVNSACHFVSPPSYAIRSGQSLTIGFGVSWWVGANDENGSPYPAPPCPGAVDDVTRVEFPLASGAITINLESAIPEAGSSVPWREVCASPDSISLTIKTE